MGWVILRVSAADQKLKGCGPVSTDAEGLEVRRVVEK